MVKRLSKKQVKAAASSIVAEVLTGQLDDATAEERLQSNGLYSTENYDAVNEEVFKIMESIYDKSEGSPIGRPLWLAK